MIERYFNLREHGTDIRTEILAGITTFLTMAYIIFVNPAILSHTGMDAGAIFVATCLAAAFGSAMMGLYANYPIALAPGMGLNAYFTYSVVLGMHYSWQVALGAVFLSAVLFLILSVLPVREHIVNAIPRSLKLAIPAGIGLFLAFIGFKQAGIVIAQPETFVTLGDLRQPQALLAILGFFLIVALDGLRVRGHVIIGILVITLFGTLLGFNHFEGVFSVPPALSPTFLKLDIPGALNLGLATIVFAFLFVDLFDNTGTLIAVADQAGLVSRDGRLPRIGRALICDSSAALVGALLGTSTTTSFIESAAGVRAGGRTGLSAVVVAILFLLALVLAPLARSIPDYATAPALVYVALLMTRSLAQIAWDDITESAPALVATLVMPLTFSIANGIALGMIAYAAIKVLTGRWREIDPIVAGLAVAFTAKYAFIGG
ncbi:MAG TPA: NCS2 family permease [Dongiaceae bacterium]|jgi:AGZA family xanthine/uracil permease-like MFS transporter|nr:NCS2 family permease [Dongiaceae bacterium]